MTDHNASVEAVEDTTDENTVTASATENAAGNSISDKLDPEIVAALSQTSEADETPAEEQVVDAPAVEDTAVEPEVAEEQAEVPADDTADSANEDEAVTDDAASEAEATAPVETPAEDAPAAEPVEDTAEPVQEDKAETVTASDEVDLPQTVLAAFEEFAESEEIDLYPKAAKINKTSFKNLLNSNQGYDLTASEAFRAEEDKQARKITTKALRDIFREQKIKMKPDEFEKEFPETYDALLDVLTDNDVSFAEWEAVTNSVGEQNFVHYVEDLALPFGTSSKQDIEEAVEKVQSIFKLDDDKEKNKKALTSAIKKALKGNGDVKFAVVWRQNAADVVSYFPFEKRIAEIDSPVLLAVAVKAADAPKSVKLDPVVAQVRFAGTYGFEHRVAETSDGKTVSNVAVYSEDLPNKESYYERSVEFVNPDEED